MTIILHVLLLRLSFVIGPFALVAYLNILHQDKDYLLQDTFFFVTVLPYIISITFFVILRKHCTKYILSSIPIIISSLAVLLHQFTDPWQTGLYVVTFTNWTSLYHQLLEELALCFELIIRYAARNMHKYGKYRILACLCLCLCHSFLILFIIQHIFTLWHYMQMICFNNNLVNPIITNMRNHNHYYRPLPELGTHDKVINYRRLEIFVEGKGDELKFSNVEYRYRYGGDEVSGEKYCDFEIQSFVGGDAFLQCELANLASEKYAITYSTELLWNFNEVPLKKSKKFKFQYNNLSYPNTMRNLTANLSIHWLDSDDFGEYKLWLKNFYYPWGLFYAPVIVTDVLLGRFILTEIKPSIEDIYVPVGGLLVIRSLPLHVFSEKESMTVVHRVYNSVYNKGSGMDIVCEDQIFHGCSALLLGIFDFQWKYRKPFTEINEVKFKKVSNTSHNEWINKFTILSASCICDRAYGEHNFILQREFYNTSSNKTILTETQLPWKYLVLPRNWLFDNKNYSMGYEEILDNYMSNQPESNWQSLLKFLVYDEDALLRKKILIEMCFSFVWIGNLVMITIIVSVTYTRWFVIPLNKLILREPLRQRQLTYDQIPETDAAIGNILWKRGEEIYDTMIINNEHDSIWVEKVVLPLLEHEGHKVYYSPRDDIPGRPKLLLASQAVCRSRNFVVVCSNEFRQDAFYNAVVFGQFVLTKVEESPESRIHLLKHSPCTIPKPLVWRNDQVDFTDWTTQLAEEEKLRILRRWAIQNKRRHQKILNY